MKLFFSFLVAGILLNLPPEVVNQIYLRHSVSGFVQTTLVYVAFLICLFWVRKFYRGLAGVSMPAQLLWYVLLGIFGLGVEWLLLGNRGAAWYGQIAMFTFWGSFGLMPVIFSEAPQTPKIKSGLVKYGMLWTVIYLALGAVNGGLGLLIWIAGCACLNIFYWDYFR
ncbi:MAG: hypothetical protein KGJ93_03355, partial [Patescibacteria group bacterium]|nr:hypothetical protein [Patescibacteria group bacterium]